MCARPYVATRGVQPDGRRLALERYGRALLEVVGVSAERAQGGPGDQDVVARDSRGGLDARGGVDGVSDYREVTALSAADGPEHDAARVHAYSDAQRAARAVP